VTVAHGTYDGTEIAVALQSALTTQASDLDVTVTYVDGRLKFESGNDFTIDDTDVNATDSMGRSVTSGSDSIADAARRRSLFHFQRHGLRSYSTIDVCWEDIWASTDFRGRTDFHLGGRFRVATITRPSGARYDFGNLNHRLEFCVCS
jgi:hypothetical protein